VTRLSRRTFVGSLAGLGAAAAGLALGDGCELVPAPAQLTEPQVTKVPRVGFVTGDPADPPWVMPLWDGLRERGWVEGQTIAIVRRTGTENDPAPVLELLAIGVDVLVTVGTATTLIAKGATTTIPIVFTSVRDPVGVGVVTSLARPGANLTGVSQGASTSLVGKQLELLRAVVPGLTHLVVIDEGNNPAASTLTETQQAAGVFGVDVRQLDIGSAANLANTFATAAQWPAHGVIVRQSGLILAERARIADLAAELHLPALYQSTELVEAGGLMSYGTKQSQLYRRLSVHVDRILRGAKPADLPVEQLTTLEFAVNVKAAQALGITIPPDVAAQVTEWVS
jgi:putative ABC transport system substrate-binding protein